MQHALGLVLSLIDSAMMEAGAILRDKRKLTCMRKADLEREGASSLAREFDVLAPFAAGGS